MKKFKFSLDSVLDYKGQVLEALQSEHGAMLARVLEQENALKAAQQRYLDYNEEFCARKNKGILITDAILYQNGLRVLENQIQQEQELLEELRRQEEKIREKVVEAKKDTSVLEKLREKKLDLYQKDAAKAEELFIDEFVNNSGRNSSAS